MISRFASAQFPSILLVFAVSIGVARAQSGTPVKLVDQPRFLRLSGAARTLLKLPPALRNNPSLTSPTSHLHLPAAPLAVTPKTAPLLPEIAGAVQVNSEAGDEFTTQSETSITVAAGNVVVGYNDDNPADSNSLQFSGFSYLPSGSSTWIDGGSLPVLNAYDLNGGDPTVVSDVAGNVYYSQIYETANALESVVVSRGTFTGGVLTFGPPVLAAPIVNPFFEFLDKPYLAIDRKTNTLYLTYTYFRDDYTDPIVLVRSTDGGKTWSQPVDVCEGYAQGSNTVVEPASGAIDVFYEAVSSDFTSEEIDVARSTDKGGSFSVSKVADVSTSGPYGVIPFVFNSSSFVARTNEFPSAGVAPDGNLWVAFASGPIPPDTSPIYPAPISQLVVATNKGGGWTTMSPNPSPNNPEYMPSVAIDSAGVHVVYFDKLGDDAIGVVYQSYRAGAWTPPVQISDIFPADETAPNFDYYIAYGYMGDYLACASTGGANPVVYAAWGQNQFNPQVFGSYQPDVFFNSIHPGASPSVSLLSPVSSTLYPPGSPVTFTASASEAGGTIVRVDYFAGKIALGGAAEAPYTLFASLAPGAYVVQAVATDQEGHTKSSPSRTIRVGPDRPMPPSSLSASSPGGSNILLNWIDPAGDQAGFHIWRRDTPTGEFNQIATVGPSLRMFADFNVTVGNRYTYTVTAFNATGDSERATPVQIRVRPGAAVLHEATDVSQVNLTWKPVAGAATYTIGRSAFAGGPYAAIATSLTGLSYADTSQPAGSTRYFVVYGVTSDGLVGEVSNEVAGAFVGKTVLSATGQTGQVTLTWTPVTGATAYHVQVSTSPSGPFNSLGTTSNPKFVNHNLTAGTTYYYRVEAVVSSGLTGTHSNTASAVPS